ncbi:MAG: hypothetical protein UMR38_08105 [Candidatus Izemoplasma sp.]|nr:hypothetical protein [Candidatus Izemoplasma sp.]
MKLLKIYREFKAYDGGVLKFKDQFRQKTYYFELDFNTFYPLFKTIIFPWQGQKVIVLSSNGCHLIFDTLDKCETALDVNNLSSGMLVKQDSNTLGICDRNFFIQLLDDMRCPEKTETDIPDITTSSSLQHDINHIESSGNKYSKKTSPLGRKKSSSKPHFDWAEAYEEGLRIFNDDEDEAEAYADERKKIGTYYE